jgi:hypothetical protein
MHVLSGEWHNDDDYWHPPEIDYYPEADDEEPVQRELPPSILALRELDDIELDDSSDEEKEKVVTTTAQPSTHARQGPVQVELDGTIISAAYAPASFKHDDLRVRASCTRGEVANVCACVYVDRYADVSTYAPKLARLTYGSRSSWRANSGGGLRAE